MLQLTILCFYHLGLTRLLYFFTLLKRKATWHILLFELKSFRFCCGQTWWGGEGVREWERERVWLSKHERGRERGKKHIIVHMYMHECMNRHARMPTSLNCLSFCSTPSAIALYWSACCRAAFSWVCRPDDKRPANWAPLASYTPLHPPKKAQCSLTEDKVCPAN